MDLYFKLLGHYYAENVFDDCIGSDKRLDHFPLIDEWWINSSNTIRLSVDGKNLYVAHKNLSSMPQHIKKRIESDEYVDGALLASIIRKKFIQVDYQKAVVIPQMDLEDAKYYYDIYLPFEAAIEVCDVYDDKSDGYFRLFKNANNFLECLNDTMDSIYSTDYEPCYNFAHLKTGVVTSRLIDAEKVRANNLIYEVIEMPFGGGNYMLQNDNQLDLGSNTLATKLTVSGEPISLTNNTLTVDNSWLTDKYATATESLVLYHDAEGNTISLQEMNERIKALEQKNNSKKGKESNFMNLNNLFGNLKVGKAGRDYAITYYGTVSYKGKTYYQGQIYEVEGLTLPLDYLFFVPSNTVAKGDIISKNDTAYYITKVNANNVEAVNLETGAVENLLAGGPFGMTMYSKLFNPMGNMVNGNIGNLLLMQSLMGDNKGGDNSLLMAMMFMGNGGLNFQLPGFTTPQTPTQVAQEVKGSVTASEVVEHLD